ncbi:MAG TPA: TonB-dependent receptor, partial [Pirellulales bacterium]
MRQAAAGFAVWGCLIGENALAQTAAPEAPASAAASERGGAVTAYPPAFFTEFKAANAFDMVQRLPGFSFNGGADVRGFGGAAGNVLIDGERPSSKAVPLQQILQRIPTSQVERIDLVRDSASGIDMQGQSVVANVIRKKGASATGALQLLVKPFGDGFVGFVPRIEGSWRSGPLSVEGQLGYRTDRTPNSGEGPISRKTVSGATLQAGRFKADERQKVVNFNTSAEYRPGVDVLRLNVAGAHEIGARRERSNLRDALGAFQVFNNSREEDYDWEIGGDYERPLAANLTGRLIALATFATEDAVGASRGRGQPQRSEESSEGGERILRGELNGSLGANLRLEAGAEAAFNYLDSHTAITEGGVPVILPSANVRVEERRGEAYGTANWRATPALSVEAGLRYERSTISQTGGVDQEKTLS